MDTITIKELRVDLILGVYDEEKISPRPVFIDITLTCDLTAAGISDRLSDTIDYHALSLSLRERLLNASPIELIERVAYITTSHCLAFDERITSVTAMVTKPSPFPFAKSAVIEITRSR